MATANGSVWPVTMAPTTPGEELKINKDDLSH